MYLEVPRNSDRLTEVRYEGSKTYGVRRVNTVLSGMSALSSRGGCPEVRDDADFTLETAKKWAQQAQAANSEDEVAKRAAMRQETMLSAVCAGLCAGLLGSAAGHAALKTRSEGFRRTIGGGGSAFVLFATFYVPFSFVANRCRGRWQQGKSFFDPGEPSF